MLLSEWDKGSGVYKEDEAPDEKKYLGKNNNCKYAWFCLENEHYLFTLQGRRSLLTCYQLSGKSLLMRILVVSGWDSAFSLQGAWVPPLVRKRDPASLVVWLEQNSLLMPRSLCHIQE